jgi:hypothetical protein
MEENEYKRQDVITGERNREERKKERTNKEQKNKRKEKRNYIWDKIELKKRRKKPQNRH